MWVGPPSPAQPDSLGCGTIELGEEAQMRVYVGMDVHRKRSQVAIVDAAGAQQRNRNVPTDPAQLVPILGALPPGTPVAFEAAYGWGWLVELLEELELEPHLVHPSRCKAIASARLKNDKVDAATVAQLLRADLLPEAWIAPQPLSPSPPMVVEDCCGLLDALATPIARLEREITGLAKPDPRSRPS